MPIDPRQTAPAAQRNRDPILEVLKAVLPRTGRVLEIASGTGEHVVHFARHLPALSWQPSDANAAARASIDAWVSAEALTNVAPALALDAMATPWPLAQIDALVCINMVHISPWEATLGLMAEAGRLLPPGGPLVLYGPYLEEGRPLAPSNAAFDADLRRRDSRWGIRAIAEVEAVASGAGLTLTQRIAMPANNLSLIFVRG